MARNSARHEMWSILRPQERIDPPALKRGLQVLTAEVVFSALCDSMMAGTILTAFALQLGAKPAQIGVLATVAFWAQLLQGPGVLLVERARLRKLIAVVGLVVSAAAPAAVAALAFAPAGQPARLALVAAITLYCGAGAVSGCAWNAWTRDLIPREVRGRYLARRSRIATASAVGVSLLAAGALDVADHPPERLWMFAGLYALAFLAQLGNAGALARVPEPPMPPAPEKPARLVELLGQPLRDAKFRPLIRFSASWQFAVNLAQPFFTIFFLQQLGFGVSLVMTFTIVSQLASAWGLKRWGALIDRFGDKSVLNVAAPTFILCIAAMVGASQLHPRWLAAAYLIVVHVVMGLAGAGVSLASGNIALKLSPHGAAAPYLSLNSLVGSVVGGLAPMLGGLLSQAFAERKVGLVVEWSGPRLTGQLLGIELTGWDFYFVLSALCGLYALHRLAFVGEAGELGRREMMRVILERARSRFARPPAVAGAEAPEGISQILAADDDAANGVARGQAA
jgi:MFS family permease